MVFILEKMEKKNLNYFNYYSIYRVEHVRGALGPQRIDRLAIPMAILFPAAAVHRPRRAWLICDAHEVNLHLY